MYKLNYLLNFNIVVKGFHNQKNNNFSELDLAQHNNSICPTNDQELRQITVDWIWSASDLTILNSGWSIYVTYQHLAPNRLLNDNSWHLCMRGRRWKHKLPTDPFDEHRQEKIKTIYDTHQCIDARTDRQCCLQQFMKCVDHVTDSTVNTLLRRFLLSQLCVPRTHRIIG